MQAKSSEEPQSFVQELGIFSQGHSDAKFEDTLIWQYHNVAKLCYDAELRDGFQEIASDLHERVVGKWDANGKAWLGFRGSTDNPAHWIGDRGNLKYSPATWSCVGQEIESVHSGFAETLNLFTEHLQNFCSSQNPKVIHVTGHSRGGALATLAGLYLAKVFEDVKVKVAVFGCPRVGGEDFAKVYRGQRNLQWVGILHSQDVVGRLPLWGCDIHPQVEPATCQQTRSLILNAAKAHFMEAYLVSLKCDFILRNGISGGAEELLKHVTDPATRSALSIGVLAVQRNANLLQQQVQGISKLLEAARLQDIFREVQCKLEMEKLSGTVNFLSDKVRSGNFDAARDHSTELEKQLYQLVQHASGNLSKDARALLLESILQASMTLVFCGKTVGEEQDKLNASMRLLAQRVQVPLLTFAGECKDADAFFKALPTLVQVEAACAAHLKCKQPMLMNHDLQAELLPLHLRPLPSQKAMKHFFEAYEARCSEGAAKLLSSKGLGEDVIKMLKLFVEELGDNLSDTNKSDILAVVDALEQRMWSMSLPEVVVTGPTKSGKSTMVNALLGKNIASSMAIPDSLFPVRLIPEESGLKYRLSLAGSLISEFKSQLPRELQECFEERKFAVDHEVCSAIQQINEKSRAFLNSDDFQKKFGHKEGRRLTASILIQICLDWAIEVRVPVKNKEDLPLILVDLPGNTEGGVAGDFINTMIRGSCQRAVAALLAISPAQLTTALQVQNHVGPMQRFFAGVETLGGYFLIVTQVTSKKALAELSPKVQEEAAKLQPEPMATRFVNSIFQLAYREYQREYASKGKSLPEEFPEAPEEQELCKIIYRGVQGHELEDEDLYDGATIEKTLAVKSKTLKESTTFTEELLSCVNHRFPFLFLGPAIQRIESKVRQAQGDVNIKLQNFIKNFVQKDKELKACRALLDLKTKPLDPEAAVVWVEAELFTSLRKALQQMVADAVQQKISEAAEILGTANRKVTSADLNVLFDPDVVDYFQKNVYDGNCFRMLDAPGFQRKVMLWLGRVVFEALREQSVSWLSQLLQPCGRDVSERDILQHLEAPKDASPLHWHTASLLSTSLAIGMTAVVAGATEFGAFVLPLAGAVVLPALGTAMMAVAGCAAAGYALSSPSGTVELGRGGFTKEKWLQLFNKGRNAMVDKFADSILPWVQEVIESQQRDLAHRELSDGEVADLQQRSEKIANVLSNVDEFLAWTQQPGPHAGGSFAAAH